MGCGAVLADGVDVVIYIAGDVAQYSAAWVMVYFGGRFVVQFWCYILPLAKVKVFACDMAFVRDWWNGLLFLCGFVWIYFGYLRKLTTRDKKTGNPEQNAIPQTFVCGIVFDVEILTHNKREKYEKNIIYLCRNYGNSYGRRIRDWGKYSGQ